MEQLNQEQKEALKVLEQDLTLDNMWNCVIAFQNYPFYTASGLPYQYVVKVGRKGQYTKELVVDRRAGSKTLAWGSFSRAFDGMMEKQGEEVPRPKALGDIRGVSYIYPLFYAFGLIQVPEGVKARLEHTENTEDGEVKESECPRGAASEKKAGRSKSTKNPKKSQDTRNPSGVSGTSSAKSRTPRA